MAKGKGKNPAKLASRKKDTKQVTDTRPPRIEYLSAYVGNPDTRVGEEILCRMNHGVCEASSHKGYVGKTRAELEKTLDDARDAKLVVGQGGWKSIHGTWFMRPSLPRVEAHIKFDLLREEKQDDELKTGLMNGIFNQCFQA